MKPQELKLECEVFDEFRVNLDAAIRMAIKSMTAKELRSGNVTAKIDIELKKEATEDGEIFCIPRFEPDINIKIGAKGNLKCKEKGRHGNESRRKGLVYRRQPGQHR